MADKDIKDVGQKRQSKGKSKGKNVIERGGQSEIEAKSPSGKLVTEITSEGKMEESSSVIKENQNKTDKVEAEIKKRTEKSREEILAEREAKRLAKAQKKKGKDGNTDKQQNEIKIKKVVASADGNENQCTDKKLEQPSNRVSPQSTDTREIDSNDIGKENHCTDKKVEQPPHRICPQFVDTREPDSSDKGKEEVKSKAQLRAERRALQEAQRAKKLEKAKEVQENKSSPVKEVPKQEKIAKINKVTPPPPPQDKMHKVKLFAHLYRDVFDCIDMNLQENIHPSIVRLGTQYRSKVISGSNARCLALLNAFKTVVTDYTTPPNQEFSRGLEAEISKSMVFLNKCRPVAVSMVNAVKHLKFQVNQMKSGNEGESKKVINEWIDTYIKEQIEKAAEAISLFALEKITHGDVILTYSCSSLIQRALIKAYEANIKFRVIVVDGRPWLEGKEMLRRLVKAGINCTYVFFNGLSFIMPEVTKILLGAHALLANGYVMSRAGSSQIALLAKTYNVPVLVCCETHKFSEKVQTDSFVHNELGDPDKLIAGKSSSSSELSRWRTMQYLTPLNLTYDVTPPDLVSAVVTEIAVLPCTSVPVILRVKPPDMI